MYGHQAHTVDPRDLPTYTIPEAARYLGVPAATVRYWSVGRGDCRPLIEAPCHSPTLLSFLNLTELFIVAAIRRKFQLPMSKVRKAIDFLLERILDPDEQRHPLISRMLATDEIDLFIDEWGSLISISQKGQMAIKEVIGDTLKQIERDDHGIPTSFPLYADPNHESPKIVINHGISGGRPVIAGTGFATEVIAERWKAGESIERLAQDYERKAAEIEEAVRCELRSAA